MTDDILRFISPNEADTVRARILDFMALALQAEVFDLEPEISSATLNVSQYFFDEASDEVHARWEFSRQSGPTAYAGAGKVGEFGDQSTKFRRSVDFSRIWSGQYWCIPLFASYSPEGFLDYGIDPEHFGVAAWFDRSDDGLTISVLPDRQRSWVDGVVPLLAQGVSNDEVREEFWDWLDWVDPAVSRWKPEQAPLRDRVLDAFDIFRGSLIEYRTGLIGRLDADRRRFEQLGPGPYDYFPGVTQHPFIEVLRVEEQITAYATLCARYQEARKLVPPPRAAFRS